RNSRLIPNAIVRSKGDKTTYFGHQLQRCRDYSALHYRLPFEKGYLVDWDAQKAIWDGVFSSEVLNVDTAESSLLITEPYFNLPNIQDVYDQFVFEEYEFHSYHRCTPASMIPYGRLFQAGGPSPPECLVVIDSGFSFTHVVPIINNQIQWYAVKRLDVGGKLLTNQLKELVSYRQWNMMDETYIMNHAKETCCYVSTRFFEDIQTCRSNPKQNSIVQEYILPNFSTNRHGHVRVPGEESPATDQVLHMENERFTIPELLFRPDDIGLEQSGLATTVAASISLLPDDLRGMFWANIGLIGGSTNFPGFYERLSSELLSITPVEYDLQIYRSEDAVTEAYRAALAFVKGPTFSTHAVSREEYLESGSNASRRKFPGWQSSGLTGDPEISKVVHESTIEERGQPSKKPSRPRMRANTTSSRRR
ncbi:hypothetical protein AZE42_03943, partial [Rhizopogon vesiculosus]